jgi:hypothetical protein
MRERGAVEKGSVRLFGHDAAVVLGSALRGNFSQIELAAALWPHVTSR